MCQLNCLIDSGNRAVSDGFCFYGRAASHPYTTPSAPAPALPRAFSGAASVSQMPKALVRKCLLVDLPWRSCSVPTEIRCLAGPLLLETSLVRAIYHIYISEALAVRAMTQRATLNLTRLNL